MRTARKKYRSEKGGKNLERNQKHLFTEKKILRGGLSATEKRNRKEGKAGERGKNSLSLTGIAGGQGEFDPSNGGSRAIKKRPDRKREAGRSCCCARRKKRKPLRRKDKT